MGFKSFFKSVGKAGQKALPVLTIFFPQLSLIEKLSKLKNLTSQEKQDLAFTAFSSGLFDHLLPDQVEKLKNDEVFELKVRKLINDSIDLENYVHSVIKSE